MQRIAGTPGRDRSGRQATYAVPAPVNALQVLAFALAASLVGYMAVLGMREALRDDIWLDLRKDKGVEAGVELKQPTPVPVPSPTREGTEPTLGG